MASLRFEWDPKKDAANEQKHGISFEAATVTFQDPLAAVHTDPDHSDDEKREILVGHGTLGRLLLVVSSSDRVRFGSLPPAGLPSVSVKPMKQARRSRPSTTDDMRPEYDFDYSKARSNPYAARLKDRVAVVLDPDVAAVFPTSEAVNTLLRSVVAAVPRRVRVVTPARRRSGRTKG
jgi:uncharacterized DUF497 family protein